MKQVLVPMVLALGITALSLWWHRPTPIPESFIHEPRQIPTNGLARLALGQKICINRARVQDFEVLPGIGAGRAASIVAWREQHGPFRYIEDLQKVPGIGPMIFQRLEKFIEISP